MCVRKIPKKKNGTRLERRMNMFLERNCPKNVKNFPNFYF